MNARMTGKRGARHFAQAGHDIERAGGKTGVLGDAGEGQRREAGFLRWLDHGGVACRQGADHGAADDLHGIVPGNDVPCDAMRFAQGEDGIAAKIGDGFAVELVGGAGIEFEITGQRQSVGARLLQRLADVTGLQLGQHVGLGLDRLADLRQHPSPLCRGQCAPGPGKSRIGGGDGGVDIGGGACGQRTNLFAGGRVFNRQVCGRCMPAAADKELFRDHRQTLGFMAQHLKHFGVRAAAAMRWAPAPRLASGKALQRRSKNSPQAQ